MAPSVPCTWLDDVRRVMRADWPAPTEGQLDGRAGVPAVHQAPHWVLWADGTMTSTGGLGAVTHGADIRPDAADLIDAVWHSNGHRDFRDWPLLARVERVIEQELLGVRWPLPWEEQLERLVVETVDGAQQTLFLHAVLPENRPSTGRVTVHTTLPEALEHPLDRPEPTVLYDLENPLHGMPRAPAGAPRYILVRPGCAKGGAKGGVTAFHRRSVRGGVTPSPVYTRREHPSLRAVMSAHGLHPNQVRPVWEALHAVPLATVALVEAQRWDLEVTVVPNTGHTPGMGPGSVTLWMDGTAYGPCGSPWDVASILAARSPARRSVPVRTRGKRNGVTRASVPARR